jgi:hypothetical protein
MEQELERRRVVIACGAQYLGYKVVHTVHCGPVAYAISKTLRHSSAHLRVIREANRTSRSTLSGPTTDFTPATERLHSLTVWLA